MTRLIEWFKKNKILAVFIFLVLFFMTAGSIVIIILIYSLVKQKRRLKRVEIIKSLPDDLTHEYESPVSSYLWPEKKYQ